MKKKKKNGFIFVAVLVITILLFAITTSVTMLTRAHGGDLIKDIKKDKAYYIANAGLEIVYSALNKENVVGASSILQVTGSSTAGSSAKFKNPKKGIIKHSDLVIIDGKGNPAGYCDINADLEKDDSGNLYYKVESTGKSLAPSDVTDTRTRTMFVFLDSSTKLYDGIKDSPY